MQPETVWIPCAICIVSYCIDNGYQGIIRADYQRPGERMSKIKRALKSEIYDWFWCYIGEGVGGLFLPLMEEELPGRKLLKSGSIAPRTWRRSGYPRDRLRKKTERLIRPKRKAPGAKAQVLYLGDYGGTEVPPLRVWYRVFPQPVKPPVAYLERNAAQPR
jgi:hypothetical protein